MSDKTLRELQTNQPWTIRYSRDFRADPRTHKDFAHALLHVGKALGKLQGLADDMDHDREVADDPQLREKYGKYLADLVVCALRASNTFPGGVFDLQTAVEERIKEKNKPALNQHIADCNCFVCQPRIPDCCTNTVSRNTAELRQDGQYVECACGTTWVKQGSSFVRYGGGASVAVR